MKKFNSLLEPDMNRFLQLKESLGYSRGTYKYQLTKIDEYALSYFPQLTVMNETFVLGWSKKHPEESKNSRRIRLYVIREFGKFQQIIKQDAYVLPTDYIDKQQSFIPYLFTDDERNRQLTPLSEPGFYCRDLIRKSIVSSMKLRSSTEGRFTFQGSKVSQSSEEFIYGAISKI